MSFILDYMSSGTTFLITNDMVDKFKIHSMREEKVIDFLQSYIVLHLFVITKEEINYLFKSSTKILIYRYE